MKTVFKKSFLKEIEKISDEKLKDRIANIIISIENSSSLDSLKDIKKLTGFTHHFRIRIGNYRIGIYLENDMVCFSRFGHRKDIYKRFP